MFRDTISRSAEIVVIERQKNDEHFVQKCHPTCKTPVKIYS